MKDKIYILILNWNGWKDTIECLESVFRNDYPNYRVIVCDNDSQNGSFDKIRSWAEGNLLASNSSQSTTIKELTQPSVPKPIHYVQYNRTEAELGGNKDDNVQLILIQTGGNLGFAGGNNVGLRYVLKKNDFSYIWLLNNDTVIKPNALNKMVERMEESPKAGICGSTLLYYHDPNTVQAYGGATFNKWLGISKHIGGHKDTKKYLNVQEIESRLDYIVGASMLISRKFIEDIGLLGEEYFLYYEEIDWATRGKNYKLLYAPLSFVYHKEGGSISTTMKPLEKSFVADYYMIKNRIVFTRKYYPLSLPLIYLGLIVTLLNRVRRRQYDRVKMILKIIFSNC